MQRPAPKMPDQFFRWSEGQWPFEAKGWDHIQDSEPSGDGQVQVHVRIGDEQGGFGDGGVVTFTC